MIRSRAFTILELLITIGIVAVLVGLTVAATGAISARAEVQSTTNTLRILDATVSEWEIEAGRQLTWGAGSAFDVDSQMAVSNFHLVTTAILDRVLGNESARDLFSGVQPDRIYEFIRGEPPVWHTGPADPLDFGTIAVLDAWDTPIYALHPGRRLSDIPPSEPPSTADEDGTERTANEYYYGVAIRRRICFVSNGPDGQEGRKFSYPNTPLYEQTLDNLYSYPVGDPWAGYGP